MHANNDPGQREPHHTQFQGATDQSCWRGVCGERDVEHHVPLFVGVETVTLTPPRVNDRARSHGGDIHHTASGSDCSHPGDR